jgi:hypothetical protein
MTLGTRLSLSALVAGVAGLLAACSPAIITPPAETVTVTPAENRDVVPSPPEDPVPAVVWPLTGLSAVGAPTADLNRVPIPIKVENTANGRPQKGLEYADIVFEEYINSACLRLMAIFHSTYPEDVGPIRSARNMDPNIVGSFKTVLVASGSNYGVQSTFRNLGQLFYADDFSGTTGLLQGSEGFHRVPRSQVDKDQEFRLWGHPATFAEEAVADGIGPATQQFDYAYPATDATASVAGTPVGTIDLKYSSCGHPHWVWDAALGVWQRFEFDDPHMTMDGNQINAANVIILRVKVAYTNGYNPESFVIVSDAPGFVATGGNVVPIVWTKADRGDTFHLSTLDGDPVYLAPGQTWIEMVPLSGAKTTAVISFDGVVQ